MKILLAVSGGIAAYKTPDLVRRLRQRGHEAHCMLTANAQRMVTVHALAAVSQHAVHTDMWRDDGSMPHIDLVRACDCLLIAPASANCLARCALGLADDLVTTAYLALDPQTLCVIAPAMNTTMYNKPIVQQHLSHLGYQGASIVSPVNGTLACGEEGIGAMADAETIIDQMEREFAAR